MPRRTAILGLAILFIALTPLNVLASDRAPSHEPVRLTYAVSVEDLAPVVATAARKPIVRIPAVGKATRAFKEQRHFTPNRATGTRGWDQWLRETYGSGD